MSGSTENSPAEEKSIPVLESNQIADPKSIPLCQRERLPFIHLLGISIGTLAPTLLWNILFTLFYPLTVKLKVSSIAQTMILFTGGLAGFVVSPISGDLSDRCMCRWGRRRIYMVVNGLIVVLALLLLMFCVEIGSFLSKTHTLAAQQGIMVTAIEICLIAGNFLQTPARSICSDVCPPSQQITISGCVAVYSGFGGIFSNLVGALELYKYTSLSQESFVLVIGLVLVFISLTITCVVTPEVPLKEKPPSANPFKSTFLAFKNIPKPIWRAGIAYLFSQIGIYQMGFQFTDFMGRIIEGGDNAIDAPKDVIDRYQKGVSWAMMCNIVNYGIQFLYSFLHPILAQKIGMKIIWIVLMAVEGVMFMLFFWIKNSIAYLFINIPVGLATVAYLTIPQSVVSLTVPVASMGQYMGLLFCFSTLGNQISNFGIGMGLGAVWKRMPHYLIGISCIFMYIAAIAGFWLVFPEAEKETTLSAECSNINKESSDTDEEIASETENFHEV